MFIEKTRPFITLQGIGQPTIVWNDTNFLSGNHTFDSATFGVAGNFFLARNITFQVSTHTAVQQKTWSPTLLKSTVEMCDTISASAFDMLEN